MAQHERLFPAGGQKLKTVVWRYGGEHTASYAIRGSTLRPYARRWTASRGHSGMTREKHFRTPPCFAINAGALIVTGVFQYFIRNPHRHRAGMQFHVADIVHAGRGTSPRALEAQTEAAFGAAAVAAQVQVPPVILRACPAPLCVLPAVQPLLALGAADDLADAGDQGSPPRRRCLLSSFMRM